MDEGADAPTRRARGIRWLRAAALILLVAFLYAPSLDNEFIYDDHVLIVNESVRDAGDLLRVFGERHWFNLPYYRPLSRLTMMFQKWLHGNRPSPFHVFNVSTFAAAVLLAHALLRLPVFRIRGGPAWLAAALFAAHPVASSCVYPICSGRETLIPAVFALAALLAHLRGGRGGRVLALLCFALALLSKEQAVVIPALFVLADALRVSADAPGGSARRWAARYAPVLALLGAYAALRWLVFGGAAAEIELAVLRDPAGPAMSFLYAVQTAFAPFAELFYEPRADVWPRAARLAVGLAALGGLVWAARGAPRALLFFLGVVVVSLAPTANFVVQEARFAERFGFLALVGFAGLAGLAASAYWQRRPVRVLMVVVGVSLLSVASATTLGRARFYSDDRAFHTQWIRSDPRAAQPHVGLGELSAREGRLEESAAHYRAALAIDDGYAAAHASLGVVLVRKGELEDALRHMDRALELAPDDARTHTNRGAVLARLGRAEEAAASYRAALAADAMLAEAHNNLGALLVASGDADGAALHYRRALEIDPDLARAHLNLGILLARSGDPVAAVERLRAALALDPDLARAARELAWILATSPDPRLRDGAGALRWAERAARATGHRSPRALETLAAALAASGRLDDAVVWQQRAVALDPGDAAAQERLDRYRGQLGAPQAPP